MLREEDKKQIKERLKSLEEPVTIAFFTQVVESTCQYCSETEQLLKEVKELSDKIELKTYNFVTDKEQVESYQIDKIPAIAIHAKEDVGIRYYGIPTGYEFATFLENILLVSQGKSELNEVVKKQLAEVNVPVKIQVFVTPTCPYCPRAAMTASEFALENKNVRAETVEISEFPHLAQKYGVMGVPKVVINETISFEGALPEDVFFENIKKASVKETA